MTATYNPATLETSDKDRLRAMVGDATAPFLLSDEEIVSFRALAAGIFSAAADISDALAGRFAPDGALSIAGVGIGSGQARYYLDLAKTYRERALTAGEGIADVPGGAASLASGGPVATGISVGEMLSVERDYDRPPSHFSTIGPYRGYRGWR